MSDVKKKITGAGIGTIAIILMVFTFAMVNAGADTVRQGVRVENIDISGMTIEEADEAINDFVNERKNTKVSIDINGNVATTTLGELGYKWKNTNVAKQALGIGKIGNVIRRYKDELDVEHNGIVYELETDISEAQIKSTLETICSEYNVGAVNASLELVSGEFNIIPERTGAVMDYETTASNLYKYIVGEWDEKSDISVEASVRVEEPKYTAKDFENISTTPMGSYSTTFSVGYSYENRNGNIKNGARLLDGHTIYPGEQFSLNEHLAPWTAENGYFPAGTYVDGGVTDSMGGGICQVSSTLYNALLLAEIDIVERYPHSMSVGYVPLAADAALAGDYKDLVFENNTDAPIYIQAIYYEGKITFNVYGHDTRDPGRTLEYISETVSTTPIETEVEEDENQPEDYEEVISSGHTGYVAKLWKHVYVDGKETDVILVNTSTYRMSPTKMIKGTKKEEETTTEEETTAKEGETTKKGSEETTKADKKPEETKEKKDEPKDEPKEDNDGSDEKPKETEAVADEGQDGTEPLAE